MTQESAADFHLGEAAKWHAFSEHPEWKRMTERFSQEIQTAIEELVGDIAPGNSVGIASRQEAIRRLREILSFPRDEYERHVACLDTLAKGAV